MYPASAIFSEKPLLVPLSAFGKVPSPAVFCATAAVVAGVASSTADVLPFSVADGVCATADSSCNACAFVS